MLVQKEIQSMYAWTNSAKQNDQASRYTITYIEKKHLNNSLLLWKSSRMFYHNKKRCSYHRCISKQSQSQSLSQEYLYNGGTVWFFHRTYPMDISNSTGKRQKQQKLFIFSSRDEIPLIKLKYQLFKKKHWSVDRISGVIFHYLVIFHGH